MKTYLKDGMKMTGGEWNRKIKPLIENGQLADVNKEWGNSGGMMMVYQSLSIYLKDTDGKVYYCSGWTPPGAKTGMVNIELKKKTPEEQWEHEHQKYIDSTLKQMKEKQKYISFNFCNSENTIRLDKETKHFRLLGTTYYVYCGSVYKVSGEDGGDLNYIGTLKEVSHQVDITQEFLSQILHAGF
jgi:hypothetical protein